MIQEVRAVPIVLALLVAALCPATAFAQASPAAQSSANTDTVRLTDAERMRILDSNTEDSAAAARGEMPASNRLDHGIHGEVGVAVGTNGFRSVDGIAAIPLGDHAGAVVSFESTNYPRRR